MSVSLSSSLILALSIEARGLVARPVPAQKRAMFCETMPASRAAISSFPAVSPLVNLEMSEMRKSRTGAGEAGPPGPGLASGLAPGARRLRAWPSAWRPDRRVLP